MTLIFMFCYKYEYVVRLIRLGCKWSVSILLSINIYACLLLRWASNQPYVIMTSVTRCLIGKLANFALSVFSISSCNSITETHVSHITWPWNKIDYLLLREIFTLDRKRDAHICSSGFHYTRDQLTIVIHKYV